MSKRNPFGSRDQFSLSEGGNGTLFRLGALEEQGLCSLSRLPFSIRVLLESALRNHDDFLVRDEDVKRIAAWDPNESRQEIPFIPVLLKTNRSRG